MNLEALLTARLGAVLPDPAVRTSQHADFQSGAALPLARQLRRPPREIAADVIARADLAGLATAEVSGPGFINLTIDDRVLTDAMDRPWTRPQTRDRQTVVIDYSAPNVAKDLHVGHLRSTIIGDAAARLLEWLGHDVRRANHLGDWGTPFGMLIEHLIDTGDVVPDDLSALYREARARFDADDEFRDRSRKRVVAFQGGDPATLERWHRLVAASQRQFLGLYDRLGVSLTAGDFAGESFYNDMLAPVVDELSAKGLLRDSGGALCAFPAGFAGRDGEPLPLIVRKSDGGFGYAATDLAALRFRVRDLAATRLLYVVGTPQRMHFQMVFAVAREAGWLPEGVSAEHVGFGSMLGADGKMFRSRSGDTIRLADLLDEAERRASAPVVGIGALKYADLSSDRLSDYVFDFDRMLSITGNTGPYLQMAYARIRSIFDKVPGDPGPVRFTHPAERALALTLTGFTPVVLRTAETLEFHRLAQYLFEVASAFSVFFENCPVLRAETDEVRASRLTLCDRTARTLGEGLGLLGIATPARI